ncbi:MAG: hypothetical protein J3K34DRAFT_514022 [Monoraphidium minutum]|nr:MAG: hypothetical protein J3K34DRAFT_514022 [Monoraphidium minutum]
MASFLMLLNMSVLTSALRGAFKSSKAPAAAAKTPKTKTPDTTSEAPATEDKTPASKTPGRRASSASDASAAAAAPERSTSPAVRRIKEAYLKAAAGAHAAFDTEASPLARALSRSSILNRSASGKKAAAVNAPPASRRRSSSSDEPAASPPAGLSTTASSTTAPPLPLASTPEPALPSPIPAAAADEECAVTVTLASAAEPKAKAKVNSLRQLFARPAAAAPKSPAAAAPKAKIALVAAQLKAALARSKGGEEGGAPARKAGAAFASQTLASSFCESF